MSNSNGSNQAVEALLARMKSDKAKGQRHTKEEIALAAAVVLMEVASSDHVVDKFEKAVIHNGLRSIFRLSDETVNGLLTQAKSRLGSMRSSSADAELLRDTLDMVTKQALGQVMDNLIRCNGVVDSMELYLRKRFRDILGIQDNIPPTLG
jgi:uncharacterized tellurite resistance protein B-like protein